MKTTIFRDFRANTFQNISIFSRIFLKYWPQNHRKPRFLNFGLVHVDVKLLEDSESDFIFSNFRWKNGQKQGFMSNFHIFEYIEIYPNLAINHGFWPLLRTKSEKIRSDSESSCNFTSICTKPNIKNQFFPGFQGQYF